MARPKAADWLSDWRLPAGAETVIDLPLPAGASRIRVESMVVPPRARAEHGQRGGIGGDAGLGWWHR